MDHTDPGLRKQVRDLESRVFRQGLDEQAGRDARRDWIEFNVLHRAPAKPRQGMLVFADGADWNPGHGEGAYEYVGAGAWRKLRAVTGRATLVGGTAVVSYAGVTDDSNIQLTCQVPGGTPGFLRVSARTASVSFTILSSSGTDTSVVAYAITE